LAQLRVATSQSEPGQRVQWHQNASLFERLAGSDVILEVAACGAVELPEMAVVREVPQGLLGSVGGFGKPTPIIKKHNAFIALSAAHASILLVQAVAKRADETANLLLRFNLNNGCYPINHLFAVKRLS
jgi:hypothetical protein